MHPPNSYLPVDITTRLSMPMAEFGPGGRPLRRSRTQESPVATKDQLETFARAVLEDLEQVDGAIMQLSRQPSAPVDLQRSTLQQIHMAATHMPRRRLPNPQTALASSASFAGASTAAIPPITSVSSCLSSASCSSLASTGSTRSSQLAAVAAMLPPELASHRVTRSCNKMHRAMSSAALASERLDAKIERAAAYSGKNAPPVPTLKYEDARYAIAAETDAEERIRKHAAARAAADAAAEQEAARARAAAAHAQADAEARARAAAEALMRDARGAALHNNLSTSGQRQRQSPAAKVHALLFDPPKAPKPPPRPVTGLDQLATATGIGGALAASPQMANRAATMAAARQAKRPTTGGGFLQTAHTHAAFPRREDTARAATAAATERYAAPSALPGVHSPLSAQRPETAMANLMAPPSLPASSSEMPPDTPESSSLKLRLPQPHTFARSAPTPMSAAHSPGAPPTSPHASAASGVHADSDDFMQTTGTAENASSLGVHGGEGGVGTVGEDGQIERLRTRGVMPMRISRRWTYTAPVQGLVRKPLSKHSVPAPWTPFLIHSLQHQQGEERTPEFSIEPFSAEEPMTTPTGGSQVRQAMVQDFDATAAKPDLQ